MEKPARYRGLVFDKDGTLFDFQATWGSWAAGFVTELADGDESAAARLADALEFDLAAARFRPSSPVIAGTMEIVVEAVRGVQPNRGEAALRALILASTSAAPQVEAAPLGPLLGGLRAQGFVLGLATNDAEAPARAHLEQAGVLDLFDFVAGYDSGFGAKPGPGMPEAFSRAVGLPAHECVMIGDSTHDLDAGRAAGMAAVAVLTGPARRHDLEPHADAVLPTIAHLPRWLGEA